MPVNHYNLLQSFSILTARIFQKIHQQLVPVGAIISSVDQNLSVESGYLRCDGTTYNKSQYPNLAAVISPSSVGETFAVPNIQTASIDAGGSSGQTIGLYYYIKF